MRDRGSVRVGVLPDFVPWACVLEALNCDTRFWVTCFLAEFFDTLRRNDGVFACDIMTLREIAERCGKGDGIERIPKRIKILHARPRFDAEISGTGAKEDHIAAHGCKERADAASSREADKNEFCCTFFPHKAVYYSIVACNDSFAHSSIRPCCGIARLVYELAWAG